ncbi:MAG: hypothetical protein ISR59_10660 [Anaerolineales bacterium]|uniref:Uncharacterized protein n=1 Tax=Candidatus Desulfolinea nitratireducens TaxID=2841698 RepID=A0A8J6TFV6_9CHLR|nr:hypothetical protein [Candidatus Desulfolinea nitratireducens]MBL6961560.1 hypothetical protein [Anaerolineales bacterium]
MNTKGRLFRIRSILIFFVLALGFSGLTAIPLRFELNILNSIAGEGTNIEAIAPSLSHWISLVQHAIEDQYQNHAFLAYGYDWLAFGHFVIAIAFIGAVKDPIQNRWVIEFGMIACVLIIPYALILGHFRGIPMLWRMIDMLFGILGIIPLYFARKMTLELESEFISAG